jgi:hypothetical protein
MDMPRVGERVRWRGRAGVVVGEAHPPADGVSVAAQPADASVTVSFADGVLLRREVIMTAASWGELEPAAG